MIRARVAPIIAFAALAALLLIAYAATRAEAAKVANPGTVKATLTEGFIRIKGETFTFDPANPVEFTGTVSNTGALNFPTSGQKFPNFQISASGFDLTVKIIPVQPATGTLNPLTGAADLRLRVYIKIDGVPFGGDCAIGSSGSPIDVNALITGPTSPPGPNTSISGQPYNVSNGRLKLVNNSFSVPSSGGCGPAAGTVNDTLGLPSGSGNNEAQFTLQTTPVLQKGIVASFNASPSSGHAPLTTTLNASGSTLSSIKTCAIPAPSTPNCGYRWDFDGNGTTDQVTNGPSVTTTYSTPGSFQPRLTIFDNEGDSDTTTRSVSVSDRPDLTIDKRHAGNFTAGGQGSYTLSVDNIGGGVTTGTTTVTDTLPAGLSFASASGSGWSCGASAGTVTCTRATAIPPGGSAPDITLNVNVGDAARPAVLNTASVATPIETATTNNTDSDATTVDAIDVAIDKGHTGSFRVNRNETYELRVTNDGTLPTSGTTTVTDDLPVGMTHFSHVAPPGWTCTAGEVFTCTNPSPLPPGYDETIELRVAVSLDALPERTNTATISTPGDTDPSDDSSSDPTVVVAQPDLAIDKSHAGNFRVGALGEYKLRVRNEGALPTEGTTTVTDSVPAGLPVVSATGDGWDCDVSGQDVSCESDAVLQPDEAAPDITVLTEVTEAAMPGVTNTAEVATSGTGSAADPNAANDSDSDATNVNAVDLAIEKAHVGSGFPIGGNGSYTLAVRNDGTAPTAGATTVVDTLPADLSYVSASGSGWSCGAAGQDVTCTRAASIPAGSAAPTITLNVAIANTTAEEVTNEASVATLGDIVPGNDTDGDTATLTAADLEIDKSHSGDFRAGTTRSYNLRVRNIGTLPTGGTTTVTDVLPAGLSFVSASGPGWTCGAEGQEVTCTRSTPITGGGPASTIQVEVEVGTAAHPEVVNTASVDNALDRNGANDSDSDPTTVHAPDLRIAKTHDGELVAGGVAAYDIEVENVGDAATASAATVTDELPEGLSYAGFTGSQWSCAAAGPAVTCEHAGAIGAGEEAAPLRIRAKVTAAADTQITNSASVAVANDTDAANDSDDDIASVGRIDVAVDKESAGELPRGGQGIYRIDVANEGSVPTAGPVVVTDDLPDGLRFASAGGNGWECDFAAGTITCAHEGPIDASSTAARIIVEVLIEKSAPDTILNEATVATRDDADPANDSDDDVAPVSARAPDAELTLRPRGELRAGASGTYGIVVRNVGSGPTAGATTASLTLPGGVTYKGSSGQGWTCSASGQTVNCSHAAPLAVDGRSDVGIDVDVAGSAGLTIWSGSVTTPGDPNPGNDTRSELVSLAKIDAAVTLSHQGDFTAGSTGRFAVQVKNAGSAATVGSTTASLELPAGLRYSGGGGDGWSCGAGGAGAICERSAPIPANGTSSVELQVKPTAAGVPRATAAVTVDTQDDAVAANDRASDTVAVKHAPPSLRITGGKLALAGGKVAIEAGCMPSGGPCAGKLALGPKAGSSKFGSGTLKLEPGSAAAIKIKLSKKAKKTLAKKGKLKAVASYGGASAKVKIAVPKKG